MCSEKPEPSYKQPFYLLIRLVYSHDFYLDAFQLSMVSDTAFEPSDSGHEARLSETRNQLAQRRCLKIKYYGFIGRI